MLFNSHLYYKIEFKGLFFLREEHNGPSITRRPQKGNEAAADLPDLAGESPVDAVVMAHGAGHLQDIKCLATTQVHERKPASYHHRMPRWPMPTETCEEALAGPSAGPDLQAR